MTTPAWWVGAVTFAIVHILAFAAVVFYCFDNYYDQLCPIDPIGYVLFSPAYFFTPLFGASAAGLILIPLNSFLWGCVLVEPIRWWCGWPPWRISMRKFLIAFTVIAVLLALSGVANQHSENPLLPVVQPCCG
jgi:hypothetical protein